MRPASRYRNGQGARLVQRIRECLPSMLLPMRPSTMPHMPLISPACGPSLRHGRGTRRCSSRRFDFAGAWIVDEMRERLELARPADLDQAARVPGITPAALSVSTLPSAPSGMMIDARRGRRPMFHVKQSKSSNAT